MASEKKPTNHPSGYQIDGPIKASASLDRLLDDLEEAPVVPEIVQEYLENPVKVDDPPGRPEPDPAQMEREALEMQREIAERHSAEPSEPPQQQAV